MNYDDFTEEWLNTSQALHKTEVALLNTCEKILKCKFKSVHMQYWVQSEDCPPYYVLNDLGRIHRIHLAGKGVTKVLPEISKFPFLEFIRINQCTIGVFPDMSEWKYAKQLEILFSKINDPENIGKITALTDLILTETSLTNVDFIDNLKELIYISMNFCNVMEITPFFNLPNLMMLDLSSNAISSIEGIEKSKNLRDLNLSFNNVLSIEPITNKTHLEVLNFSQNPVKDFTPLTRIASKIIHLTLTNMFLNSWDFLNNMKRLVRLSVSHTNFSNINHLRLLKSLVHFEARFCMIEYIPEWYKESLLRELKENSSLAGVINFCLGGNKLSMQDKLFLTTLDNTDNKVSIGKSPINDLNLPPSHATS